MSQDNRTAGTGFNIWAFIFTWLWYFFHGIWLKGLAILVVQGAIGWILSIFTGSPVGQLISWAAVGAYCGVNANADLRLLRPV